MTGQGSSRRGFLRQGLGLAAGGILLPAMRPLKSLARAGSTLGSPALSRIGSMRWDRSSSLDFTGDDPDLPHEFFWDKWNVLQQSGGVPAPSEYRPLVIVGGGISGLLSAWQLRDQKPLLLEQASRLGGNSKGEQWGDLRYSIGAAYLSEPDEDDDTDLLLKELGIRDQFKREDASESLVFSAGKLSQDLWSQAPHVLARILEIGENTYPGIPFDPENGLDRDTWEKWDRMSFEQWLLEEFGSIPTAVKEYLTLYCWSSFGMDLNELSALQALNFLSADLGGTIAAPGGNALIAQTLQKRLFDSGTEFRSEVMVVDIQVKADGVHICVADRKRRLKTIRADRCIVAAPKFVARLLLDQLPKDQAEAMGRLGYRAYLVANVLLKSPIKSPSYELFRLENRKTGNPRDEVRERPFTDLCFASWAADDAFNCSGLTLYKAMPFIGARHFLFADHAHDKYRGQFERGIPEVLSALGISETDVAGIRLTRWGHALPEARQGFLVDGSASLVSKPFAGKVFFANQDNYANPCFETAYAAAREAVAQL